MSYIAIKFGYVGKYFHGFQRQPRVKTVEGEIRKALQKIGIYDYSYASRTDKGVSALGNVLSFSEDVLPIPMEKMISYLNSTLPHMFFHSYAVREGDFNPRLASERWYRVVLPVVEGTGEKREDGEIRLGLHGKTVVVDRAMLESASRLFIGAHNFSFFSRREEGRNPVRTIHSVEVKLEERVWGLPPVLIFDIKGESFLWMMVRYVVGAIIETAAGRMKMEEIVSLLSPEETASRLKKPAPIPPNPLILMDVAYENLRFMKVSFEDLTVAYERFMESEAAWIEIWHGILTQVKSG